MYLLRPTDWCRLLGSLAFFSLVVARVGFTQGGAFSIEAAFQQPDQNLGLSQNRFPQHKRCDAEFIFGNDLWNGD